MKALLFVVAGRTWGIDACEILAVRPASRVATVPAPPAGVLGVAAFRGDVVTVMRIPGFGGAAPLDGSIVRLAPPREHLAVWVPGTVSLGEAAGAEVTRVDLRDLG